MLNIALRVFYFEFLLLWRRAQEWLYPLAFFAIVICLFPLVFSPDPVFLKRYLPGCVWLGALFANLLSIENIFITDTEDGFLEQLALNPLPMPLTITLKLLAQWLVTSFPIILLTPLIGWLFQMNSAPLIALILGLLFGTPLITLLGSLGVALTLGLKQPGILLGLMVLPLIIPVLIFGVNLVHQVEMGLSVTGPLAFMAGIMILGVLLIPWGIAAAIRVGLDD